jgi:hypothetical protein
MVAVRERSKRARGLGAPRIGWSLAPAGSGAAASSGSHRRPGAEQRELPAEAHPALDADYRRCHVEASAGSEQLKSAMKNLCAEQKSHCAKTA